MTNELRIGNYVLCDGKPQKVTGVIKYGVYFDFGYCPNNGLIKPIELTEEWLLKFGFEKNDDKGYSSSDNERYSIYSFKYIDIAIIKTDFKLWIEIEEDNWYNFYFNNKLKYVNQLQNLYFALTGQELKLNENL